MIVFFTDQIVGSKAFLTGDEARHCSRVLRKRVGDSIMFIDGLGCIYESKLLAIGKSDCELDIIDRKTQIEKGFFTRLAISPLKSLPRFEWFIEKAVETGIDEVIPLICNRTEKMNFKPQRLQSIIVSASKQTLKAKLMQLHESVGFSDFIKTITTEQAFIPHLNEKTEFLGKMIHPQKSYTVLIGPEGDFTDNEVDLAIKNGFLPASLGQNRLRTETAGIIAGQIISTVNEINQ